MTILHSSAYRAYREMLTSGINDYVPEKVFKNRWVRNPCNVDIEDKPEDITNIPKLQEPLIEIHSEETFRYHVKK